MQLRVLLTCKLVPRHAVVARLRLEPLHGEQVQVPLVAILLELANLQARTLATVTGAADLDVVRPRFQNGSLQVLEMGVHGLDRAVGRVAVGVSIVVMGDDDGLEQEEYGKEHAEGTTGGAMGGHAGEWIRQKTGQALAKDRPVWTGK